MPVVQPYGIDADLPVIGGESGPAVPGLPYLQCGTRDLLLVFEIRKDLLDELRFARNVKLLFGEEAGALEVAARACFQILQNIGECIRA